MTPARASAARARGSSRTGERLRRLLAIVPYVLRHPGTELDELSRLFGVGREDLVRDLNVLLVTGVPPFYPHQMVDVEIDEERVWISAADHLSDPVRLTRDEALALYLQGKALLGAPGLAESGDLASALAKLESALQESLGGLAGGVEVAAGPSAERERAVLDAVRAAVADRERLAIRYYSASRDEVTNRRIDPEHVFAALGHWYVAAWEIASTGPNRPARRSSRAGWPARGGRSTRAPTPTSRSAWCSVPRRAGWPSTTRSRTSGSVRCSTPFARRSPTVSGSPSATTAPAGTR